MKLIKVGLVDNQKLFIHGLGNLLSKENDFEVVLKAYNGKDLQNKLSNVNLPDIVTMDTTMPIIDGFAATRWLREEYPNIKVLILAGSIDAQTISSMVRLGVRGFLSKDSTVEELITAIKNINDGLVYYPEFVTRILVDLISNDYNKFKLNAKEVEFLKLAATELTYKEIADNMGISSRAVDAFRDQLFEKLQIKSRIGLALYAMKNKLISL